MGYAVLHGSGPPPQALGEDNDFYIDTATTELYGPKEGGVWGSSVSINETPPTTMSNSSPSGAPLPVWFDPQTGGPNLSVGNTYTQIQEPSAYSNVAFGCGWRPGLPETGNLALMTTGYDNTAVGGGVLVSETTGHSNTAVGADALSAQNGTANNTAIGAQALESNTVGKQNTAVGSGALADLAGANSNNTALGASAMQNATSSNNCVAVGNGAGTCLLTGGDCTFIGSGAGARGSADQNYMTLVGYNTLGTQSGVVAIGVDHTGAAAQATAQDEFVLGTAHHQVKISNNATGAGSASLGSNSPATTLGAPYTWFTMMSSDGSTVFVPAWK